MYCRLGTIIQQTKNGQEDHDGGQKRCPEDHGVKIVRNIAQMYTFYDPKLSCLLYTSDAADE